MPRCWFSKKLIDVIRFALSADDVGFSYCKMACSPADADGTGCGDCARPVLYRDNVPAFNLFAKCLTQFRTGFYGPTGLDYSGVDQVMRMNDITPSPALFNNIQVLEHAYLQALQDASKKPAALVNTPNGQK